MSPDPSSGGRGASGSGGGTPSNLTGTVVRGASLAAVGFVLAQALNLGFYIALARLLEPSEFGQFAAASVLVAFAALASEGGMISALIQRRDRVEEAASTAAVASVGTGIAFSLLALAAAPLIGLFFDSSTIGAVAAAMSGIVLVLTLGTVPEALLQRRFSFIRRLVVEPLQVIVFGVVSVVAAENGYGPWSLVMGQYAGYATRTVMAWILARWRPDLSLVSFAMWRELVRYGRHIFFAHTVFNAGQQIDTVIVGRFLGTAPLGQFRYGFRLASTGYQMLLAGAAYVLFPAFSRIAHDRDRLHAAFLRSLRWMALIALPVSLVLIPLGEPLAVLVFGDVWRDAGYAAMAMSFYTAGHCLSAIVAEALKADGRPDPLLRMYAVSAVGAAIAMIALTPLGLTAVAAGVSIGAIAGAAYSLRAARRVLGVRVGRMLAAIWPPAAAAAVMAVAVLALDRLVIDAASRGTAAGLAGLALELMVAAAVFLAALSVLAPGAIRELTGVLRTEIRRRGEPAEAAEPLDEDVPVTSP